MALAELRTIPVHFEAVEKLTPPMALVLDNPLVSSRLRRSFFEGLEEEGMIGVRVASLDHAKFYFDNNRPNVVFISRNFSEQSGGLSKAVYTMRDMSDNVPIIVLGIPDEDESVVAQAIRFGADHYERFTDNPQVVSAHLRAILRRYNVKPIEKEEIVQVGDLTINLAEGLVLRDGQEVRLSRVRKRALMVLAKAQGRVTTKQDLAEKIWGTNVGKGVNNLVKITISGLREALRSESAPDLERYVKTKRDLGYRLAI